MVNSVGSPKYLNSLVALCEHVKRLQDYFFYSRQGLNAIIMALSCIRLQKISWECLVFEEKHYYIRIYVSEKD